VARVVLTSGPGRPAEVEVSGGVLLVKSKNLGNPPLPNGNPSKGSGSKVSRPVSTSKGSGKQPTVTKASKAGG
jgi:hypothetical protein